MSTMQRLTLIGLYNYNNELFDLLTLPEGYDKDVFIDALLLEHGEKLVLYPSYESTKYAIGVISSKWALELERIYQALTAEYDPTWNYDRHEEYKDVAKATFNNKTSSDHTTTAAQPTDSTFEKKVSAYNSGSYEPDEKSASNDGTKTVNHKGTDADTAGSSSNEVNHTAHMYGNIGVTTATQMIDEVLDQRLTRNLYNLACEIFSNELLIQIY